ncbi:hypothetical protein HDU84_009395 [Entophlyctis sp. JEL0112]|nr:hypothetical protein HDU84_009395 [Entophlyctis sp. JEL0112]
MKAQREFSQDRSSATDSVRSCFKAAPEVFRVQKLRERDFADIAGLLGGAHHKPEAKSSKALDAASGAVDGLNAITSFSKSYLLLFVYVHNSDPCRHATHVSETDAVKVAEPSVQKRINRTGSTVLREDFPYAGLIAAFALSQRVDLAQRLFEALSRF